MASRIGAVCLVGLVVGCAAAIGSGCSDDNSKKVPFGNEGGEAGEATGGKAGTGGKGGSAGKGGSGIITPEGGAAGETPVGEAGQGGGAPVGEGGAAGAAVGGAPSGEGGAAGALAMCVPTGTTTSLNLNGDNQQKACRGAIVSVNFNANDASDTFTCCGMGGFNVEMQGVTINSGDGAFGDLAFVVPADAPLGLSNLTTTCAGGDSSRTFDVDVTDTLPPNVQGLEESTINTNDPLMVDGSNLSGVTRIDAIATDGVNNNYQCFFDSSDAGANDLDITCTFDGIQPGTYAILVQQADCGAAVNQPELTVRQPTL